MQYRMKPLVTALRPALAIVTVLTMSACHDDRRATSQGGTTPPPQDAPLVTFTTPLDGATDQAGSVVAQATFSTAMNAETLTTTTFTLTADNLAVPGTVSYNADAETAAFTPGLPLDPATTYLATVTSGAMSANNVALESAHQWSFSTAAAKTFGSAGQHDTGVASGISVDRYGDTGAVVWQGTLGDSSRRVFARVRTADGWGPVEMIDDPAHPGNHPGLTTQVGIDASGAVFAAWSSLDGGARNWINRYDPATGWGTPVQLNEEGFTALYGTDFHLAVAPSGEAFAAWPQTLVGADNYDVYVARFDPATSQWQAPTLVISAPDDDYEPRIELNGQGQAVLAAVRYANFNLEVHAAYFDGGAWGSVLDVADDTTLGMDPVVGIDDAGTAFVAWVMDENAGIRVNRYDRESGWTGHHTIAAPQGASLLNPALAVDPAGNAMVGFTSELMDASELQASLYSVVNGWQPPERIDVGGFDLSLSFGPGTGFVAALIDYIGNYEQPLIKRYSAHAGWGQQTALVNTGYTNHVYHFDYALGSAGEAISAWGQGVNGIWGAQAD